MSQENSLNMLDKYFMPGRVTQIIGESPSLKESFLSIYLAYKAMKDYRKTIFIFSKPTLNIRYIYEVHKNFEKESFSEENRLIIISMQNVDVPRDEITKLLNIITLITRNTYKIMDALRIESREL